jgi:hypothetical protein
VKRLILPLALLLALGAGPSLAKTKADTAGDPQCSGVVVPYAGQGWCVDESMGPVQGVVTQVTLKGSGVELRGIYFVNDDGGWHAGGTFIESGADADLKDAKIGDELKLVVSQ